MTEHLPGPWLVFVSPEMGFQVSTHTEPLVVLDREYWGEDDAPTENEDGYFVPDGRADISDTRLANARLIAAAPDLLAVCQELSASADYWSEYDVPLGIVDRINLAIAKATGEE